MNQLYDVNTAARLLAVSPWTVRAYIRTGKLRPVRFGRLVRLTTEELERFVAEAGGNVLPNDGDAGPDSEHVVSPSVTPVLVVGEEWSVDED